MSIRDGINIAEIIDQCKEFKDGYNNLKKLSKPLEEQIKKYHLSHPNEKLVSDKWQANITITTPEEFNEEKAIEIIKENLPEEFLSTVIKTKEYIDDEAFEKLLYNNKELFDINLLNSCKSEGKSTVKLTIGKRKDK